MNKKKIEAKIIADSINQQGDRITTYLLTYPRFIHSELMTHRMFSRNSASSRAIPFEKMVKMVEEDPFTPIAWQKSHVGMQGTEYWTDNDTVTVDEGDEYEIYTKIYSATEHFITEWLEARDLAIAQSYELNRLGVTKQLCNRLLEPFMWHTTLVTATDFDGWFKLRCPQYEWDNKVFKSRKNVKNYAIDKNQWNVELDNLQWLAINKSQAEIHIQALAEAMWDAINESKPKELKAGEWHIPFGDNIQESGLHGTVWTKLISPEKKDLEFCKVKVAVARCARLSYMTFDRIIDYEKDIKLHDTLLKSHHMSPFEHCARAMSDEEYSYFIKGYIEDQGAERENLEDGYSEELYIPNNTQGYCNNFKGFVNYRYLLENK